MIVKVASHDFNWHLKQVEEISAKIRELKVELKFLELEKQKHLDIAQNLMQGQLTLEDFH